MPTIDWNVKNAINRDVERQHLNKILADIRASVQSLESKTGSASLTPSSLSTIKDAVGQMVVNNTETGISVTYNNLAKVLDFAVANFMLTLAGDVTGSVTLSPGSNAVIQVAIDPALIGIGEAPMDNQPYWRQSGGWEMVPPNISTLTEIATSGIMVLNTADPEEPVWTPRTIQNGAGIDWTNPDGVAGDPQAIFNADTAEVASLPGATYKTVQKTIDVMFSPGIITGGEVTELTTTSVRITAGTAVVRIADDNVSELRFFDFPSQDFSVPDVQVTHFYALDYNGGSPVIVETTVTESWDRDTQIPLGSALRGDGLLNITANPYRVGDVITNLIQRLDAIGPVQRDNSVGGLALGETGTRNATVSAGRLWSRVSDFTITSKNSSVDTMASVYFNGVNLTVTSGLTQWDNLNFNNLGTGSLQVMGNNKYANLWFFMSFNGDHYGFAYGTNEYNTLGDAANEGVPAYLTQNFFNQFILLGRFIFQKSAATASVIESAFVTPFSSAAINTHNNLGGLQGGVVGEYYHLTSAEYTKVQALPTSSQPLDADLTAIAALASTGFATRTAADTWAQRSFPDGTGFTWTNPAGVAGDPTLVLNANLQAWSGLATSSKENAITAGTTAQFWRGDKTFTNRLIGPFESQVGTLAAGVTAPVLNMLTDNAAGTAAIKVLRGPTSNSSGIVFAPTNVGVQTDFVFLSHDGMMGIGAAPVSLPFELIGTGSASTGWLIGSAFNSLGFTPTLRVEFNDSVAVPSGSFVRYGANASSPFVLGFKARGTGAAPTQVLSGDGLMSLRAGGWHSGGAFSGTQIAEIMMTATEDFTSTAQGTRIRLRTTLAGTTTTTDRFTVENNGDCFLTGGRLYGTALHNNASGLTGTTNQYVGSGTYTPTGTGLTNVTTVTPNAAQWTRVGNVVTVSGSVSVTPTAAAPTKTTFNLTFPIASNLTGTNQCGGSGGRNLAAQVEAAVVLGDTVNDQATIAFMATSTGAATLYYSYTYLVL